MKKFSDEAENQIDEKFEKKLNKAKTNLDKIRKLNEKKTINFISKLAKYLDKQLASPVIIYKSIKQGLKKIEQISFSAQSDLSGFMKDVTKEAKKENQNITEEIKKSKTISLSVETVGEIDVCCKALKEIQRFSLNFIKRVRLYVKQHKLEEFFKSIHENKNNTRDYFSKHESDLKIIKDFSYHIFDILEKYGQMVRAIILEADYSKLKGIFKYFKRRKAIKKNEATKNAIENLIKCIYNKIFKKVEFLRKYFNCESILDIPGLYHPETPISSKTITIDGILAGIKEIDEISEDFTHEVKFKPI